MSEDKGCALVLVSDLVASGKSTVSRAVAERLVEAEPGERWRRDLAPDFEEAIYADLLRRADEFLSEGEHR